jgi:hypothetical protein
VHEERQVVGSVDDQGACPHFVEPKIGDGNIADGGVVGEDGDSSAEGIVARDVAQDAVAAEA